MADEKSEEKEVEKHEEKRQEDLVSSVVGAAFLIWLGIVLLAGNVGFLSTFTDILDSLPIRSYDISFEIPFVSMRTVQVFLIGGGLILLVEVIIRLLVPVYRRHVLGTLIGAVAMLSIGLGYLEIVGPLILVAIGASILVRGFTRRR
ncbi:MAG: hypothetical protein JXA14_12320 [Anaerolineae bacterium]|nr:hypothetical protein [Anaerolineae bacterium]